MKKKKKITFNVYESFAGVLINCGSSKPIQVGPVQFIPDEGLIDTGNTTALKTPNLLPLLTTLRFFPDEKANKYCYVVPSVKGGKYLVRTSYYYGGFDEGTAPPVFDQIIDGTKWGTVNTTDDYAKGLSSYYEIVFGAAGTKMSVCLARNAQTVGSPFISGIEIMSLGDSLYNTTDLSQYALSSVARHSFGHDDEIIRYRPRPVSPLLNSLNLRLELMPRFYVAILMINSTDTGNRSRMKIRLFRANPSCLHSIFGTFHQLQFSEMQSQPAGGRL